MFSPLKIFVGLGTVIGTGGAGLAGTYVLTKKTILDGLENKRPVSIKDGEANSAWTKLVENLKSTDVNKKPKSEKFTVAKNNTDTSSDLSKLKTACEEASIEIYSTIFYTNDDLLNDFKKFCVISLGEMLTDAKKFTSDTADKATLKTKLETLKNHSNDAHGKIEENEKLKNLKNELPSSITQEVPEVRRLFQWCKDHYESSYVSDSDNLKKLVYSYCQID